MKSSLLNYLVIMTEENGFSYLSLASVIQKKLQPQMKCL